MDKKDKNKISQTGKTVKTGPAGNGADFKNGSNYNSLPENKADIKAGESYSFLSGKLYLLILIGLAVAVLLMFAGFGLKSKLKV